MATTSKRDKNTYKRIATVLAASGIGNIRRKVSISFWYNFFRIFKSRQSFTVKGQKYTYFYHKYNATWRNERAVEIPVIWSIVKDFKGSILEVGNVLSHYFPIHHDVVDKYEKAPGVINEDVTQIQLTKKYDLVISISTLEHVGWDEQTKDAQKVFRAVNRLRSLLNPKGKIVASVPLGYNPYLDTLLKDNGILFDRILCLKRISGDNRWIETVWTEVMNAKFNSPFPFANGLVIGIIES